MQLTPDNTEGLSQLARKHGWLADEDAIVDLRVPGAGNMNRVLRGITRQGHTLIFKQALPYVAKFPDIPAPVQRLDSEALFYAVVRADAGLASHTPRIIGYDPEHHLLCQQDLGDAPDLTSVYSLKPAPSRHPLIEGLCRWLSTLHHLPVEDRLARRLTNKAMRRLNHEHIFVLPFVGEDIFNPAAELAEITRRIRADRSLGLKAAELGEIYLGKKPHPGAESLLHGDFYPGSWLAAVSGDLSDDLSDDLWIIDPEFCFVGPAEFDVGVMRAHLIMGGYPPPELDTLLSHYDPPGGFCPELARQFCGIEIIRRIIGVAQLPLQASLAQQATWVNDAVQQIMAPA